LIDLSPFRLFAKVLRNFGFATAVRVAYFRVRGALFPALALPDPSVLYTRQREVSILLSAGAHRPVTLNGVVDLLADRDRLDWEVCVCARFPLEPESARALSRHRGGQPWIRIIEADEAVDDATAAQWTIEQATGRYVALLGPEYAPKLDEFVRLLSLLRNQSELDAAALVSSTSSGDASSTRSADCILLLQRKSSYLAAVQGRWPLTAPGAAGHLEEAGVPAGYVV
jgi:hypothetical protein